MSQQEAPPPTSAQMSGTTTTSNFSTMQATAKLRAVQTKPKINGGDYVFKGENAALDGNVFQVHSEQRRRGQFNDTLDALKVFASTKYVNHIKLSPPTITRPTLTNNKITVTLSDGSTREIDEASKEELLEFEYKIKF